MCPITRHQRGQISISLSDTPLDVVADKPYGLLSPQCLLSWTNLISLSALPKSCSLVLLSSLLPSSLLHAVYPRKVITFAAWVFLFALLWAEFFTCPSQQLKCKTCSSYVHFALDALEIMWNGWNMLPCRKGVF